MTTQAEETPAVRGWKARTSEGRELVAYAPTWEGAWYRMWAAVRAGEGLGDAPHVPGGIPGAPSERPAWFEPYEAPANLEVVDNRPGA